ncbi:amidase [Trinickia diaoshuihuensis]|uniref:amidase n=1 Tax=Trinickia diaoshuihuensis TaxID=2292265 RepID=UPI000E2502B1|nr:amidase [Trinickia diaoshuihuensis]
MNDVDLTEISASDLLMHFEQKRLSPVEVTRAVLERADRVNPILNAFRLIDHERALDSAKESEARWLRGEPLGLLDGVPVSIKDLILTKGWATLRGSRTIDPNQAWDVDAPCTARLREAGAVLFGKTCTPEFACKCETTSPLTGISRNPWNRDKSPGGSSGGSAAAVAAGAGPLSVGTDGAGSMRIPAAFCGTFGMKPSFGRAPTYPPSAFASLSHIGPHTMSVEDAALLMNVLKQPDARDWAALPFDPADYRTGLGDGIRGVRVAYSPTLGFAKHIDPQVAAAVRRAALEFEALGARVEEVDPGIEDPIDLIAGLWFSGMWAAWQTLTPEQRALTDPDVARQAELGEAMTMADLLRIQQARMVLGSRMRQFMASYDLILTPTVSIAAFDATPSGAPMSARSLLGWTPFSYLFNLTHQPAASIPCGLTSAGLPIGLQIAGPMFGDALVLRAARAYEASNPIPRPPKHIEPETAAGV